MKTYQIRRVTGAPDWDTIESLAVDCVCWLPDADVRMTQQVCYDETAIYVRQCAVESELRAELSDPLSMVCEDSCMEFFFAFSDDGRYFNFECNPNGCIYLGFGGTREQRVRLVVEDAARRFDIRTSRTSDGWTLSYRLPLNFLKNFYPELRLETGLIMRANCYKCGERTRRAHYLSWNRMTCNEPDFHRTVDFGRMIFC